VDEERWAGVGVLFWSPGYGISFGSALPGEVSSRKNGAPRRALRRCEPLIVPLLLGDGRGDVKRLPGAEAARKVAPACGVYVRVGVGSEGVGTESERAGAESGKDETEYEEPGAQIEEDGGKMELGIKRDVRALSASWRSADTLAGGGSGAAALGASREGDKILSKRSVYPPEASASTPSPAWSKAGRDSRGPSSFLMLASSALMDSSGTNRALDPS
jgi:hypothetical protein